MRNGLPFSKPKVRLLGNSEEALPYLGGAYNLLFKVRQVCDASGAPVFALSRKLPDGTLITAAVVGNEELVSCTPASADRPEDSAVAQQPTPLVEGIVFEPSEVLPTNTRRHFGTPFRTLVGDVWVDINPPLGTPMGAMPVWVMSRGRDRRYNTTAGNPRNYGCRNWVGRDGTVLSWRGMSSRYYPYLLAWAGYASSTAPIANTLVTGVNGFYSWVGETFPSTKVFRNLEVVLDISSYGIPGVVAGAALKDGALVFAVVTNDYPVQSKFYAIVDGLPQLLGQHTFADGTIRVSDWYYNQSGTSAVCSLVRIAPAYMPVVTVNNLRNVNLDAPNTHSAILATFHGDVVIETVESPPFDIPYEDSSRSFGAGDSGGANIKERVTTRPSTRRFVYAEYVGDTLRKVHYTTRRSQRTVVATQGGSEDYSFDRSEVAATPNTISIEGYGEYPTEPLSTSSGAGWYRTITGDVSGGGVFEGALSYEHDIYDSVVTYIDARHGVYAVQTYHNEYEFSGTDVRAFTEGIDHLGVLPATYRSTITSKLAWYRGGVKLVESEAVDIRPPAEYARYEDYGPFFPDPPGWRPTSVTRSDPSRVQVFPSMVASCVVKDGATLACSLWSHEFTSTVAPAVFLTGMRSPVDGLLSRTAPPFFLHNIGLI